MRDDGSINFGSGGGVVEVDETFMGREPGKTVRRGVGRKMKVLTLVDRNTGAAKSVVVDGLTCATLLPILIRLLKKSRSQNSFLFSQPPLSRTVRTAGRDRSLVSATVMLRASVAAGRGC